MRLSRVCLRLRAGRCARGIQKSVEEIEVKYLRPNHYEPTGRSKSRLPRDLPRFFRYILTAQSPGLSTHRSYDATRETRAGTSPPWISHVCPRQDEEKAWTASHTYPLRIHRPLRRKLLSRIVVAECHGGDGVRRRDTSQFKIRGRDA